MEKPCPLPHGRKQMLKMSIKPRLFTADNHEAVNNSSRMGTETPGLRMYG
jgi:hypothetical protein